MKKILVFVALAALLLSACGGNPTISDQTPVPEPTLDLQQKAAWMLQVGAEGKADLSLERSDLAGKFYDLSLEGFTSHKFGSGLFGLTNVNGQTNCQVLFVGPKDKFWTCPRLEAFTGSARYYFEGRRLFEVAARHWINDLGAKYQSFEFTDLGTNPDVGITLVEGNFVGLKESPIFAIIVPLEAKIEGCVPYLDTAKMCEQFGEYTGHATIVKRGKG